jgi:glycosyltransferase involved in cell wall biosynthesis
VVGKPTTYSRTGPGAEVTEDGVSGLLCDPPDAADVAAQINAILENPALAGSITRNARPGFQVCTGRAFNIHLRSPVVIASQSPAQRRSRAMESR